MSGGVFLFLVVSSCYHRHPLPAILHFIILLSKSMCFISLKIWLIIFTCSFTLPLRINDIWGKNCFAFTLMRFQNKYMFSLPYLIRNHLMFIFLLGEIWPRYTLSPEPFHRSLITYGLAVRRSFSYLWYSSLWNGVSHGTDR